MAPKYSNYLKKYPSSSFHQATPPDKEEILGIGLKYILSDKEGNL